jgi:hypothetical protein
MVTKERALFVKKGLACVIVLLFVGTSFVSVLGGKTAPTLPGNRAQFYAYDLSSLYTVTFDTDAVLHNLAYAGIYLFSGADCDPDGNWYTVSFMGGLYQIDKNTGLSTQIAQTIPLDSIAFDITTSTWYACGWDGEADSLFIIDITTGATVEVGHFGITYIIKSLMCDAAGNMYGVSSCAGEDSYLYSIDKSTGAATVIFDLGALYVIQGAQFDRNDGTLYLTPWDVGQGQSYLAILDTFTGIVTIINLFTPPEAVIKALAIPYTLPDHYLIADFTWTPHDPLPAETVLFNASKSYDSDGNIILYEWDWDNDGVYDEADTTPFTNHSWDGPGSYTVTLRVTDNGSYTGQKSRTIDVNAKPPEAPIIYGPDHGAVNVSYTFYANCSGDDQVYVIWYWGDEWPSGWIVTSGRNQNTSATHAWTKPGVYEIRAMVKDVWGAGSNWSNLLVITIVDNKPPTTPVVTGQDRVKVKHSYYYTAIATDPDKDQLYYFFDWCDTTTSGWIGPYSSGSTIILSHNWSKIGDVLVRVKAKDSWGAESDWGILPVRIPATLPALPFFQWLFERFPYAFPLLRYIFGLYESGG